MLNILSHQGNTNQNPSEIPSHTHKDSCNWKDGHSNCWKGCIDTGNTHTLQC